MYTLGLQVLQLVYCFSILAVIRSRPGAFFWFNILISSFISFEVNALRRSCDWIGVAWSCSTSWSWSLLCGEKTSERYSANSSPSSLSLFAHGPGGVEYLPIGGDVVLGFFIFYRFPNRVILPFEIRDVFFKGFILRFSESWFAFVAYSVIFSSAVWCVSSLPDWPGSSLFGY